MFSLSYTPVLTNQINFQSIIKALVDINEQLFNITYHPIMDNYKMYENVTKAPFNISLNHHFIAAFQKCIRPCIEVFYSPTIDKYFITSDKDKRSLSSCDLADGFMLMSHIRKIDYELVKSFKLCIYLTI